MPETKRVSVRVPPQLAARFDRWRRGSYYSRSEALRAVLRRGLDGSLQPRRYRHTPHAETVRYTVRIPRSLFDRLEGAVPDRWNSWSDALRACMAGALRPEPADREDDDE